VVSEQEEITPPAEPAEKAAKPVARRRTRPTPAAEPVVSELEKIVPPAELEEKAAKPVARRRTRTTPAAQPEEKDVTTETGEIPQES
jgi:hypothetical protein